MDRAPSRFRVLKLALQDSVLLHGAANPDSHCVQHPFDELSAAGNSRKLWPHRRRAESDADAIMTDAEEWCDQVIITSYGVTTTSHATTIARAAQLKAESYVAQGQLSRARKLVVGTVIKAGSVAAYRAVRPSRDLLQHMMTVMEDFICRHSITGPMLRPLDRHIPPMRQTLRPSR